MNIVIVGCGDVGAELAKLLAMDDHNVTVVDKDSSAFRRLGTGFNGATVTGVGIDIDVLTNAGLERADALAAVTSEDNVNIMVTQIARQIFKVKRVVARIYDISREHVYREFGLETVCPTSLGVEQLRSAVTHKRIAHTRSFASGEVAEIDLIVPDALNGRTIGSIVMPTKFTIAVLVRDGKPVLPSTEHVLCTGDRVTSMVRLDALRTVCQMFQLEDHT